MNVNRSIQANKIYKFRFFLKTINSLLKFQQKTALTLLNYIYAWQTERFLITRFWVSLCENFKITIYTFFSKKNKQMIRKSFAEWKIERSDNNSCKLCWCFCLSEKHLITLLKFQMKMLHSVSTNSNYYIKFYKIQKD